MYGRKPSARGYHIAFLADSRLIVVGGFDDLRLAFLLARASAAYSVSRAYHAYLTSGPDRG